MTPNIESSSGSTRGNNTPVTARIETDPSQATAWQMQSSVRHVQAPGGPAYTAMPTNHHENGAPEQYRARSASAGSQRQPMPQSDAEPLPYRPHPGTGPMGVAG